MKKSAHRIVLFSAPVVVVAGGWYLMAGDLNPPGGAIAPTMKTLTEVEPRIAINATNTPGDADSLFKITQPGSYYLAGNVIGVVGKHGIEIAASGVTLDFNGFDLSGVAGSLDGVSTAVAFQLNIALVNGSIRSWGDDGIDLFSNYSHNCRVERIFAHGNTGDGIRTGGNTAVIHCSAFQNGTDGILTDQGCTISNCTSSDNGNDGINTFFDCMVSGCTASANNGDGIDVFSTSTVAGCTTSLNTLNGIRISSNNRVIDNICTGNGAGAGLFSGIFTLGNENRIEGNHVTSNDFGIGVGGDSHLIIRNYAGGNATNYSLPPSGSFIGTIVGTSAAMNAAENANVNISN